MRSVKSALVSFDHSFRPGRGVALFEFGNGHWAVLANGKGCGMADGKRVQSVGIAGGDRGRVCGLNGCQKGCDMSCRGVIQRTEYSGLIVLAYELRREAITKAKRLAATHEFHHAP